MKKIGIVLILVFLSKLGSAQTFAEWFRQNATQKKYLAEQIAALELYGGVLRKGYEIGRDGLTLISDLKNGDFNLHKGYFGSLSNLNPEIKKYSKVAEIIAMQLRVVEMNRMTMREIEHNGLFDAKEKEYCRLVYNRVLEDADHSMDKLLNVAVSGKVVMKDDERLARIDAIYIEVIDIYSFSKIFNDEVIQLVGSKNAEQREVERSRILTGIK